MSLQDPFMLLALEAIVVLAFLLILLAVFSRYQNQRIKRLRSQLERGPEQMPDLDLADIDGEQDSSYRYHLNKALQHTVQHYKELRPDQTNFEFNKDLPAEVQTTAMRLMFLHAEKQALKSNDENSFWDSIHKSLSRVAETYMEDFEQKRRKPEPVPLVEPSSVTNASGQPRQEAELLGHLIPSVSKLIRQAADSSKHLTTLNSELEKTIQNQPALKDTLTTLSTAFGPNYPADSEPATTTLNGWREILSSLKQAQQACQNALTLDMPAPDEDLNLLKEKLADLLWYTNAQIPEYLEQIQILQSATGQLHDALSTIRPKTQHHAFIEEMLKESRDMHHVLRTDLERLQGQLKLIESATQTFSLLQ
ncbi:hypothetical protein [Pokkaliibacter plantistimulans]|nr:hypothetical protein [Pokkaliibacter plantistimulans]